MILEERYNIFQIYCFVFYRVVNYVICKLFSIGNKVIIGYLCGKYGGVRIVIWLMIMVMMVILKEDKDYVIKKMYVYNCYNCFQEE